MKLNKGDKMNNDLLKIAKNIVNNSLSLKSGETLYIMPTGESQLELANAVKEYAISKGVTIFFDYFSNNDFSDFWNNATEKEVEERINYESYKMHKTDAVFILRDNHRPGIKQSQKHFYDDYVKRVHFDIRLTKKWCLTYVPTERDAEIENLDYNFLINSYMKACSINYTHLEKAFDNLKEHMLKANIVKIKGIGTDLTFSIKNLPVVKCIGKRNIPDGEIYTAPVKDSVNGILTYNVPFFYNGVNHKNIKLTFEKGKIIKATSNYTKELNEMLDIDEGSRYIGEFSFGVNPYLTDPLGSIMYDEKIAGSFHFTPGSCYDACNNGNKSKIHEDMVQIQTPEYGGGEIWFDDKLIRKDGLFVPKDLQHLNPKNLLNDMNNTNNFKEEEKIL